MYGKKKMQLIVNQAYERKHLQTRINKLGKYTYNKKQRSHYKF